MKPALFWFRRDLRLDDQPALAALAASGRPVVPVFIHAPHEEGDFAAGAASRVALEAALSDLSGALTARGNRLTLVKAGNDESTAVLLARLARAVGAEAIHATPGPEPSARAQEDMAALMARQEGLRFELQPPDGLHAFAATRKADGSAYKVFTPFHRNLEALPPVAAPVPAPGHLAAPKRFPRTAALADLDLLPALPWHAAFTGPLTASAARARLADFTSPDARGSSSLARYAEGRDHPWEDGTSRLSCALAFGQIGVRRLWEAAQTGDGAAWRRQLVWREFARHLLWHFPRTPTEPLDARFRRFPWRWPVSPEGAVDAGAARDLEAWQRGRTGYPLVDAGMRQLWRTGWMHNRVRMVVGSFLVKHLRLHWSLGARWFWDTLTDADLANNTLGWQWIAGCGADAAPYFRVFNPVAQSEKFDPGGAYIRRFVPELASLPTAMIHAPFEAPPMALAAHGVKLGETYPRPVVGLKEGRDLALAAYRATRA